MEFFSVTRIAEGFVAPSAPTPPSSQVLDLSVVDRIPVLRCNARTLHVFKHGPAGAAQVIRDALSKALIPYYPLAGRLHVSHQNHLQIASSGDGVWFVQALADCTLDAVNYFDDSMSIPYEKLLPNPPPQQSDPLVQMQVTQFGCKGFVIGLIFCHSICDGLGAAQFLNAVGEMARGAENPSTDPQWCRNFLPPRPNSSSNPLGQQPMIPLPDYQLEPVTIDLSIDKIKELKREFHEWSGKTCSTFEVVAALLWRQRTLAIDLDDEEQVKLVFFANCRQIVDPPLPKGFYGNCFFPVTVTATSAAVTKEPVLQVVKRIQQGKGELPNEFGKWARGTEIGSDPFAPPLEYNTVFLSEWGRLGFMEVDYGWGTPVHIVPIQGSSVIPVGIVCSPPTQKTGVRLMTWCVQKGHLQPLLHHMKLYVNNNAAAAAAAAQ